MPNIFDYDGVQWYQSIASIQSRLEEILERPVNATIKEEKLINQLYKEIHHDSESISNNISITRSRTTSRSKSKSRSKTMKKKQK